jgi:ADP-ribose pyrophosphatase YjhB (NUDIX family)
VTPWTTYTGAGAVVVAGDGVLFVRQRRGYGVHWELPGGYDEAGESLEETAAREVAEETGVAVEIAELVCTLVWERTHDRRRNVLAFFAAAPSDDRTELRPQLDEDIEAAAYLEPLLVDAEIHPLHRAILEHWWPARRGGFHVHADVAVAADGTQTYAFR